MLSRRVLRLSESLTMRSRALRLARYTLPGSAICLPHSTRMTELGLRGFRVSAPRKHPFPFLYALLASLLKSSATMELAKWTARAVFTFVPLFWIKSHWTRTYLARLQAHGTHKPEFEQKQAKLEDKIRKLTLSYRTLIAIPFVLFGLTFLASLERTPLSGRWRVILLSPEEEDTISEQLQGEGWYQAVHEVISSDGSPYIIPPSDWRYRLIESILRQLEATVPILAREKRAHDHAWLECGPDDVPLPPPARYPLRPRPAAKEYLRSFCDTFFAEKAPAGTDSPLPSGEAPHLIAGPPYNLVLVERPDCDNAFSFGFGPDGGGGIVVYSGFLERIFASRRQASEAPKPPPSRSALAGLFGSVLPSSNASTSNPSSSSRIPTEEEKTQIAILLSHELSHLILAHHLESLSAGTVFIPGAVAIIADFLRAMLFPFTMAFGPFVNDALANLGKVGSGEFAKITEQCTSMAQEFEADAVSARILAHAGYDARKAIEFWETRRANVFSECSPKKASQHEWELESSLLVSLPPEGRGEDIGVASKVAEVGVRLAKRIVGATHPAHEARLLRLKSELQRWETERRRVLRKKERNKYWKERWANVAARIE